MRKEGSNWNNSFRFWRSGRKWGDRIYSM